MDLKYAKNAPDSPLFLEDAGPLAIPPSTPPSPPLPNPQHSSAVHGTKHKGDPLAQKKKELRTLITQVSTQLTQTF